MGVLYARSIDFFDVRSAVFASHARADYRAGLEAIESYQGATPEEESDLSFWRMCLLSLLGEREEACREFARSLDRGDWWGETMLADPDLDKMRDDPEWMRLYAISLERAKWSRREERPPLEVVPEGEAGGTMVVLHGAGSHPRLTLDYYSAVVEQGWSLLAPYGPDLLASHRYGWGAGDAEERVIATVTAARDRGRVLVAGFSQGAGIAGHVAWTESELVEGVLLVAPSFTIRGVPIPGAPLHPVPTYILVGSEDRAVEDTRRTAAALASSGVPVRLDERRGMGHEWPDDPRRAVLQAIEWLCEP